MFVLLLLHICLVFFSWTCAVTFILTRQFSIVCMCNVSSDYRWTYIYSSSVWPSNWVYSLTLNINKERRQKISLHLLCQIIIIHIKNYLFIISNDKIFSSCSSHQCINLFVNVANIVDYIIISNSYRCVCVLYFVLLHIQLYIPVRLRHYTLNHLSHVYIRQYMLRSNFTHEKNVKHFFCYSTWS